MCDQWLNVGYDEEKMTPYQEPERTFLPSIIGIVAANFDNSLDVGYRLMFWLYYTKSSF